MYQFLLKRYLETTSKTLTDASEAFNRLKLARQLVRRLKDSFESLVLRFTTEDFRHLNGKEADPNGAQEVSKRRSTHQMAGFSGPASETSMTSESSMTRSDGAMYQGGNGHHKTIPSGLLGIHSVDGLHTREQFTKYYLHNTSASSPSTLQTTFGDAESPFIPSPPVETAMAQPMEEGSVPASPESSIRMELKTGNFFLNDELHYPNEPEDHSMKGEEESQNLFREDSLLIHSPLGVHLDPIPIVCDVSCDPEVIK